MKPCKTVVASALALFCLSLARVAAQPLPATAELAKALGFTPAEIARIEAGEIVSKDLKEGSDKELAGVVAVLFKKPVAELAEIAVQGKLLETDKKIQAFGAWKPDEAVDKALASLKLDATESDEVEIFSRASTGDKLNLSAAEIEQFRKTKRDAGAVSAELRSMLKARYEAYRKSGLNGIAPYVRGGNKTAKPGEELALAIKETMTAAPRKDFFQALLDYPAKPLANVEHHFYWFKQEVEGRPTFILSHRTSRSSSNAAIMSEEQFYVGHSYNSNLIIGGGLEVKGGTLVFYVNRTFTDQVAGFASGMRHNIGRGRMLDEVATKLKRARDELKK